MNAIGFARRGAAAAALMALTFPAGAQMACRAASELLTQPLVELYTSEGCDSCPPADRWLAAHFASPAVTKRGIALAFHVDYWDRLGWIDRFGSARNTERQQQAMRANGTTFVYTPQVLVQGRDVPAWAERGVAAVDAAARQPARATLQIAATMDGQRAVDVEVDAAIVDPALRRDAALFVAYVDSGLTSDVGAGENRGVRLRHEHVVRDLRRIGPADTQGRIAGRAHFARPREPGISPMLVAFVQRDGNGDVLQTATLPLGGCGSN
ncbi:MAG TPA: DUF1223 domain-containing protein [Casimicrobiaceae bacterium]|nr:DUF1223 domain-containing protein [Casimicrobiaceae bacterium]